MKAFTALLAFLAGLVVPSQALLSQTFPVKGRIVDKQTKAGIPYASVRVKNKNIGVISNADGDFELFIPDTYRQDTLLVSCLGYAGYEQAIPALRTGGALLVALEPVAYALREVVVSQKELSGLEIVRRAKKRIPDNYPSSPYSLEGYYRKLQKVNGKYTYFMDAALRIYDKGYQYAPLSQFALQEKVVLEQARLSKYHNPKGFENFADLESRYFNRVRSLMVQNAVRYRGRALNPKHYAYRKDSVINHEGRAVYVVSATLRDKKYYPYCYTHNTEKVLFKLYIDVEDYSVYRIEYRPVPLDVKGIEDAAEIVTDRKGSFKTYCEGGKTKLVIEFKKYNDKLYPHYITGTQYIIDYDTVTARTYANEYTNELLVTQVNPPGNWKPGRKAFMEPWESLESQVKPYDGEFWKQYNMIQLSRLDKQMIQDLEQELTLEEQFRKRTFREIERDRIDAFQVERNKNQ